MLISWSPEHKYDDAGVASFVGHMTDEALKSSANIVDFIKSPQDGYASPFNVVFNTKDMLYDWYEKPGNSWRRRRMAAIMPQEGRLFRDSITTDAFDWEALGPQDVVVDVGSGVGVATLTLARRFTKPQFVMQDLSGVVSGIAEFWQNAYPGAISVGRVRNQEHNFFDPQPIQGAAVYFLRLIIHNWADAECVKVLRNLRAAAAPHTKLIIFDLCAPYACEDPLEVPATGGMEPLPAPLVPNSDTYSGVYKTMLDIHMLNTLGGQERTLGALIDLGKASGWNFQSVKRDILSSLIFVPA